MRPRVVARPTDSLSDVASPSPGDTTFAALAVTDALSCGLTRGGRAFCWGADGFGSLGTVAMPPCPGPGVAEGTSCSFTPVPVDSSLRFLALATADGRVCGVTPSGRVWC